MKKALKLLLMYFMFLIFGVFLATILYSFFQSVLGFVAGKQIAIFEWKNYLISLIFITQCILIVICPLMSYYRIRRTGGVPVLITYIILSLVTWGLFFPLMLQLDKKFVPHLKSELVEQSLSGGYFRKLDDKIYYSFDDLPVNEDEPSINMLVIDTKPNGKIEEIRGVKNSSLYREGRPFRDILIKDNFQLVEYREFISFRFLITRAENALEKGLTHWLGYLSIGFLISAIYGLCSVFAWRLINAIVCFFMTFAVVLFNTIYYAPFMESFKSLTFMHNPFFEFLSSYIDEPFLCLVNVFLALIFIAIGIINYFVGKNRQVE